MTNCVSIGAGSVGASTSDEGHAIQVDGVHAKGRQKAQSEGASKTDSLTFLESWQSQLDALGSQDGAKAIAAELPAGVRAAVAALQEATQTDLQTDESVSAATPSLADVDLASNAVDAKSRSGRVHMSPREKSGVSTSLTADGAGSHVTATGARGRNNRTGKDAEESASSLTASGAEAVQQAPLNLAVLANLPTLSDTKIQQVETNAVEAAALNGNRAELIADNSLTGSFRLVDNKAELVTAQSISPVERSSDLTICAPLEASSTASGPRTEGESLEGNSIYKNAIAGLPNGAVRVTEPSIDMPDIEEAFDGSESVSVGKSSLTVAPDLSEGGVKQRLSSTPLSDVENGSVAGIQADPDSIRTAQPEVISASDRMQMLQQTGHHSNSADLSNGARPLRRGPTQTTAEVRTSPAHPTSASTLSVDSQDVLRVAETHDAGVQSSKVEAADSMNVSIDETFAALESGAGLQSDGTNLSRTGHMQARVGYQDSALGWVEVRGESSGGVVRATVISSSSDAVQMLGAHMAGLHHYLAENRTPVESVTLAPFSDTNGQYSGQSSGHDAHQGSGQHSDQDRSSGQLISPRPVTSIAVGNASAAAEASGIFTPQSDSHGRHISIMA